MSYPVTFEADYVEQRNRLTTFFRLILAIPLVIWLYIYGIVAELAIVIAWFAIVITGQLPARPLRLRRRLHALRHARRSPTRTCCATPTRRSAAPTIPPTRCAWSSSGSITTAA